MDLSKVSYHAFMRHLRLVGQQLENSREQGLLLDAAREDTPVIDGVLQVLGVFLQGPEEAETEEAISMAGRDLHVFLALRSLVAEQRAAEAATVVQVRTAGHRLGDGATAKLN